MSFLSKLFDPGKPDFEKAKLFLDEAERLADDENPLIAMEYLCRKSRGLQKVIGSGGPLHTRFIRILHKLKSRVFASNPDAPNKTERNWENLPSVLQIPLLGESVAIGVLLSVAQENNKDLIWLVPSSASPTLQDAKTMLDYTFHFADNPRLVLQFHEWNGNILIRRSFFIEIGEQLSSRTVGDLLVDLMKVAHAHGLSVETI